MTSPELVRALLSYSPHVYHVKDYFQAFLEWMALETLTQFLAFLCVCALCFDVFHLVASPEDSLRAVVAWLQTNGGARPDDMCTWQKHN